MTTDAAKLNLIKKIEHYQKLIRFVKFIITKVQNYFNQKYDLLYLKTL